jgi:hypothetical protein
MPADSFTATLNLRKPEVGAADSSWGGSLNGDLDILDAVFLATGLGTSVGLHVGAGKTLNVEGSAQFADSTDPTKRAVLLSSGITTATTRALSFPDADGTLATEAFVNTAVSTVSMQLASEAVITTPAAFLNVTFPVDAKIVELHWFLSIDANTPISIHGSVAGVPDISASYHQATMLQSATLVSGAQSFSTSGWPLGSGHVGSWGRAAFQMPTLGFGELHFMNCNAAAVRAQSVLGVETSVVTPFNGYYFSAGRNFSVGSYVRCFAVT